jgi:hypothetical protein
MQFLRTPCRLLVERVALRELHVHMSIDQSRQKAASLVELHI